MRSYLLLTALFLFFQVAQAEPQNYLINPGDTLDISVWNENALHLEVRVLPDGNISFPLAGVTSVAGKTVAEIQVDLAKKLAKYIEEPVVNIAVKTIDGNMVYVIGQVKNPGHYIMYQPTNVMQALSLAGGLTAFAKADSIIVLRKHENSSEAFKFEYSELENGQDLEKNHMLKSGDVIVVP